MGCSLETRVLTGPLAVAVVLKIWLSQDHMFEYGWTDDLIHQYSRHTIVRLRLLDFTETLKGS